MKFTVIGAGGFIGGALAARMETNGDEVVRAKRGSLELFSQPLGHVIYAAGVTADFRIRPFDALRANTGLMAEVLEKGDFESLLYLSSARIYRHAESSREDAVVFLKPADPEDLYDLTKLTAEALCHASGRSSVRVVRLTNVVGDDFESKNFLYELIRSACDTGQIVLRTALNSAKDYVMLHDVLELLPKVATSGRDACYNLGSGHNLSHSQVLAAIVACTGAQWSVAEDAPTALSLPIDIGKLQAEFGYDPRPVLDYVPALVDAYRNQT